MIIPVILEKSLLEIEKKIRICEEFATLVQIDFAEKGFVQGETFLEIEALKKIGTNLDYDLDLMVSHPLDFIATEIPKVKKIGMYVKNDNNTVEEFLRRVKDKRLKAGLCIGPETDQKIIERNITLADYIQFYTIEPGAQGRRFNPKVLGQIKRFKKKHPHIPIQVDGSVNKDTILPLRDAGVTDFIVGSAIFKSSQPGRMFIELKKMSSRDTQKINSIAQGISIEGSAPLNSSSTGSKKPAIRQVAFLGGAAWQEDDTAYIEACEVSELLSKNGYQIVNGGGPGVMKASTKGAHKSQGDVLAITYHPNKPKRHYEGVDPENDFDNEVITLDYFDRTKVMLQTTQAHVVFRGSIGTLSELGMTWISSWIHEPDNKPIVLYGDFWQEFIDLCHKHFYIVKGEEKLLKICTTPQEVLDYLESFQHLNGKK